MKKLLLPVYASLALSAGAQQYVPLLNEQNTWLVEVSGWITVNITYWIEGDTLIEDTGYKKVWYEEEGLAGQYVYGLMREDVAEKKIYVRYPNIDEELFYDFAAEVNDLVTIYPYGSAETDTVSAVLTEMVGGTERTEVQFHKGWWTDEWVVGMGSTQGLTNPWANYLEFSPRLLCFYEGNDLAWDNPDDETICNLFLKLDESNSVSFATWPNPACDEFYVQLKSSMGVELELISIAGEVVLKSRLTAITSRVSASDLEEGVYFLRLTGADGTSATKKIVVLK